MALVQKMTRNLRHPMGLRHPVISMDTYIKTKKMHIQNWTHETPAIVTPLIVNIWHRLISTTQGPPGPDITLPQFHSSVTRKLWLYLTTAFPNRQNLAKISLAFEILWICCVFFNWQWYVWNSHLETENWGWNFAFRATYLNSGDNSNLLLYQVDW